MANKLLYCIKSAFQNIIKYAMLNAIAATTISITFIIFTSFLILVLNFSAFKKNWADQLHIILYLKAETPPEAVDDLTNRIRQCREIASVTLVSQEQAFMLLKEMLRGQDGLLEGIAENPLTASLEIKLKNNFQAVEHVEAFVKRFKTETYIDDIEYGQKWLERFTALFDLIKVTAFGLGGLLFLFTLFIVSNTIKLLIYNRRDEIEIMKLVGATNRFIKCPFCIEGIIQGITGASTGLLFLFVAAKLFTAKLISFLHIYIGTEHFVFLDANLTMYILLLGGALGLTGSLFALSSLEEFQS